MTALSLLTYLYVGYDDGTAIIIDTPTILLDTIYTLRVGTYIVDIHRKNRIIGIDINVIDIIGRTIEHIAVGSLDESLAFLTFLLEVHLTTILPFGIHYHGIVLL